MLIDRADGRPWDAQIAYKLIYPLRNTFVTPNYLTSLRLLCGIFAGFFFALGEYKYSNIGAFCFVLSNFLDHADGELARLKNQMSSKGHIYDLMSDAIVNILLFLGLGIGLMQTNLGTYASVMGIIAGTSVAAIFYMRNDIEKNIGKKNARQPYKSGIEAEDVLYILPVITYFQLDYYFMLAAAIGAPMYCVYVIKDYLRLKN
ncbi:MAG: CDP-alcohol phosphatidyltransferase family protein [Pseudomonadota bacterium]|jgi:phosphatidylglycerophosphate synthase|nr:CDP-alcohol phosphatidyltransferase family protein [Pseudomonadota bacterium]